MSFIKILQGNASISLFLLRALGFLGAMTGIVAHFLTWYTIQNKPQNVIGTGLEGIGMIGIGILVIYTLLILVNSAYSILPAVLFIPYMLEQVFGLHLLRYMPLDSTKLGVALYAFLPFSAILILIGSFAPILSQILSQKASK
jgi:hypothetical protein